MTTPAANPILTTNPLEFRPTEGFLGRLALRRSPASAAGGAGVRFAVWACALPLALALALVAETVPPSDVLVKALSDELERAVTLRMEDLEKPYFVQYNVEDSIAYTMTASDGAVISRTRNVQRQLRMQVRVGSFELDNTNFSESGLGGGGSASLPLDDDYLALRQAIWLATDREYKDAVETLTRKQAYLKDKNIVERPPDFSKAPAVHEAGPAATFEFDEGPWRERLKQFSGHFKRFAAVQESTVRLIAGAQNLYIVNSEGTRLRMPDTGAVLVFSAEVQAADGMRLSNGRLYVARVPSDLPSTESVLKDIEAVIAELEHCRKAEVLERYSGPVLFDGVAGAQMFRTLLGDGLAGRPDVVGEQRRMPGTQSLEHKLGTRLLPGSFQVWDDPSAQLHGGQALLGHYLHDDEAVAGTRVELVKDGRLSTLCLSRAPTRKLSGSNGHARSSSGGAPRASIANLFIEDQKGMSEQELKAELISAAKDEGLEFALRVEAIQLPGLFSSRAELLSYFNRAARGGGNKLGDPLIAYKVSVADGSETPIRGVEFAPLEIRALRHILAAGSEPHLFNHLGVDYFGASAPVAVIAPAVLLEEAELSRLREEFDTLPLLKPPRFRQ